MANKVTILRSSLVSLAVAATMGAGSAATWAADGITATPSATAYSAPAMQSNPAPPTPKMLDLKAPDIHRVMSAEQIAAALPNPQDTEVIDDEEVAVHGATPAPYVPGGFAALYWGVTHPLQSWRIFAPVQ